MTASTDTLAPLHLTLSTHDAQWIAAVLGVCSSILNPRSSDALVDSNVDALEELFVTQYSPSEYNALTARVRMLLPADSRLRFADLDAPLLAPQPNILQ